MAARRKTQLWSVHLGAAPSSGSPTAPSSGPLSSAFHSLAKIKWRTAPASPAAPDASNHEPQRSFSTLGLTEDAAPGHDLALMSMSALGSAAGVKLEAARPLSPARSLAKIKWRTAPASPAAPDASTSEPPRGLAGGEKMRSRIDNDDEQWAVSRDDIQPAGSLLSRSSVSRYSVEGQEALPDAPRADLHAAQRDPNSLAVCSGPPVVPQATLLVPPMLKADLDYDSETTSGTEEEEDEHEL